MPTSEPLHELNPTRRFSDRAADYNAFLRAVQTDETQDFTLERPDSAGTKANSAAPRNPAPSKTVPPKP